MTKKSNYLLSLFGALLLTSSLQAQNLLPKPQQVTMGKGVFNTSDGVKVENQVGADAENIYTKTWNVKVNDAAKRVVKFIPELEAKLQRALLLCGLYAMALQTIILICRIVQKLMLMQLLMQMVTGKSKQTFLKVQKRYIWLPTFLT